MKGIYGLFAGQDCLYVGQSVDVERRAGDHLRKLAKGSHSLRPLQDFVNSSVSNIEWRLLEEVTDTDKLSSRELAWFESLKPSFFGYAPSANVRYTSKSLNVERLCAICDAKFLITNPRQKFCSHECYYEGRKRDHKCLTCGSEFKTFAAVSNFCSLKCLYSQEPGLQTCMRCGAEFAGTKWQNFCGCKKLYDQKCNVCNTLFQSTRKDAKFCSKSCQYSVLHNMSCAVCSKSFQARHRNARYCSDDCNPWVLGPQ